MALLSVFGQGRRSAFLLWTERKIRTWDRRQTGRHGSMAFLVSLCWFYDFVGGGQTTAQQDFMSSSW